MTRALALALFLAATAGASAAEVEVKMLNKGAEGTMVFEPAFVRIAPGDTVKFITVDKGHDVESIDAMVPEGTPKFKSAISQDLSVTFEKPGVYGYKCIPHYGLGMVGLVVVGEPGNVDKAKAVTHPGKAKTVFAGLFAKLDAK